MNSRDLEQVGVFRRYLLGRAARSRSRLMRNRIMRWVEQCDAARFGMRDERRRGDAEMSRLKAA
jgi:hypothetical protein